MKTSEQMGETPEQSNESSVKKTEKERKVTTPEEAELMTRQRRVEYGLEPSRELTHAEIEEIEADISQLLEHLDEYDFESFSPEIQESWYWAAMEAMAGEDRELAREILKRFLDALPGITL